MSPRALTTEERENQKKLLMEVSKKLVIERGIKNVSVDDITKACGVAKGTFYNYYDNKDALLIELVWQICDELIERATYTFENTAPENYRKAVEDYIKSFLFVPQQIFLFSHHDELEYLMSNVSGEQKVDFHKREVDYYIGLIRMLGKDPDQVDPVVIHNYIHALYFTSVSPFIITTKLRETIDVMVEGLLNYVFGEE
ncbi:MAG: TetR/AcrR family transcriptional regulator [Lachnospiraceae bacterium]